VPFRKCADRRKDALGDPGVLPGVRADVSDEEGIMREIKFRAFVNGKMIPVSIINNYRYCAVADTLDFDTMTATVKLLEDYPVEIPIMQFTGLKDKNGKEIYEGDILDFSVFDYNDHDTQYKGCIVYDGSRFMIWNKPDDEFYGPDGGFDLDWIIGQDDEAEVIGNIHENPDLIKEPT
jgi:uncharacterized phage protein (TIGR01671 family)